MKNVLIPAAVALLAVAMNPAAAQQAEIVGQAPGGEVVQPGEGGTTWPGPSGNVLFDNGPLVNSPGTGAGGADESVLESATLSMSTIGFGHQVANDNRMIEDFTVPSGPSWSIDDMVFFAYQTGSTTTSTMTGVRVQIWDGDPQVMGSQVIWGDLVTNVMTDSAWTGVYRVTETTGGATNRPIMAQTVDVGITLDPGTYWVEWQTDGSLPSGPWAPPIAILGQGSTGNALQNLAGTIQPAVDGGPDAFQQGMPIIITGISGTVEVPTLGTWGLGLMMLMILGVAVVVIRRG